MLLRVFQSFVALLLLLQVSTASAELSIEIVGAGENQIPAEREKAAMDAALDAMVNEYTAMITAKIRRNVVMPPDVRDDASALFRVTLLPGGAVLGAELKKSSGNSAYDSAVERAILKSQPLPLPADVAMFNRFRVLLLKFRPVE